MSSKLRESLTLPVVPFAEVGANDERLSIFRCFGEFVLGCLTIERLLSSLQWTI